MNLSFIQENVDHLTENQLLKKLQSHEEITKLKTSIEKMERFLNSANCLSDGMQMPFAVEELRCRITQAKTALGMMEEDFRSAPPHIEDLKREQTNLALEYNTFQNYIDEQLLPRMLLDNDYCTFYNDMKNYVSDCDERLERLNSCISHLESM